MKIILLASDNYYWLINGFELQWQKYAQGLIGDYEIAGFSPIDPEKQAVVSTRKFTSMGNFEDFPAQKWSNGVMNLLRDIQDEQVMIMLEDYWLVREVDALAVQYAFQFMQTNTHALRFDLTTDRLYSKGGVVDFAYYKRLDIIQANFAEYHVSLQAAIWNKTPLMKLLKTGETPWEFELTGSNRAQRLVANEVFGFRQWAVKYQIMYRANEFTKDGSWMYPPRNLTEEDYQELERLGYTSHED